MNLTSKTIPLVKVKLIEERDINISMKVNSDNHAIELFCSEIGLNDRETFAVICLDTKVNGVNISVSSIGTLNQALIHPREIFKVAILSNAQSIIIGHNHPSGDLTPSLQDIKYTKTIIKAGELLSIPVLDHIIVSGKDGVSLRGSNTVKFSQ